MHVDQAGTDNFALGVNDTVGLSPRLGPYAKDCLAANPKIRDLIDALRRIDQPAIGDAKGWHGENSTGRNIKGNVADSPFRPL